MEILAINGSPRKNGTSQTALNLLLEKIDKTSNIRRFDLNSMNIKGCQECFVCRTQKTDNCAINDGVSEILELAKKTDAIIVSTPVFYGDITAQLKCFIDRTWSYLGKTGFSAEHLPRDRTLVFILSYGYDDPAVYDSIFEKYKTYFNMYGFDDCYFVKAIGAQYNKPEIVNKPEMLKAIDEISATINKKQ